MQKIDSPLLGLLRRRWLLCLTAFAAIAAGAAPSFTADQFAAWFEQGRQGALQLDQGVRDRGAENRYVFIAGLNSENRDYYQAQAAKLEALGVPADHIHILRPRSRDSFDKNMEQIDRELGEINDSSREPIVLIAHSRGAIEAVAYAASHPEWSEQRLKAMFLVQAAFGGSPLAELMLSKGRGPGPRMGIVPWLAAYYEMHRQAKKQKRKGTSVALSEFTNEAAEAREQQLWASLGKTKDVLDDKIFYVRSHADPKTLAFQHWISGTYLSAYFGPSDGRVEYDNMFLEGLGHRLITIEGAGHNDLTHSKTNTVLPDSVREGLIQAIFAATAEESWSEARPEEKIVTLPERPCSWLRRL